MYWHPRRYQFYEAGDIITPDFDRMLIGGKTEHAPEVKILTIGPTSIIISYRCGRCRRNKQLTFKEFDYVMHFTDEDPAAEDVCIFCGERQGLDAFEDGLRCKKCAEEQDGEKESDATSNGTGS